MSIFPFTREQARAFDECAIKTLGIPSLVLMENAGRGAAEVLRSFEAHGFLKGRVVICCGKGNNGGDGLVMARHLANAGIDVLVLLFANPAELSPDAALEWKITQNMHLRSQVWADDSLDEAKLAIVFEKAQWIVDALFGTGLTGPVRPPFDRIIEVINASRKRVFAVDIPSGLDADTGEPTGSTIRAAFTATFVAHKIGFLNRTSNEWTGPVRVVDIGIDTSFGPSFGP
jgi:NAD(P)H-hydrate epimerase